MINLKEAILIGLKNGLNLIPTNSNKVPIVKSWKNGVNIKEVAKLNSVGGIAMATGYDLEVIDFDLKYDLTGELYNSIYKEVKLFSEELLDKLLIQTTVNKGFHWFYKTKGLTDGNLKLARREASDSEKLKKEKVKVLIETRGVGGYIMISPTEGYTILNGKKYSEIPYISNIERDFILSISRSYNSYRDNRKEIIYEDVTIKTAFDDYDDRVTSEETIQLLKNHGWKEVVRAGERVSMLRAGDTKAKHSGYYELNKDRFSVFSTSTEFEPETRYKKSAVYSILEHDGNWTNAAKTLYELGYGVTAKIKKDEFGENLKDDELEKYFENYEDLWALTEDWYDGKIKTGLKLGLKYFDNFFVFRTHALYTITAMNNIGKTVISMYLQILNAVHHGMKWIIFAAENTPDDYAETLLGYYLGDDPKDVRKYDNKKYIEGKLFIEDHFKFLKNCKSVDTALKLAKAIYLKDNNFQLFIDPINSVQPTDNIESWDYTSGITAARNIINFRKQYCSVWISMHPTIGKQRESIMPRTIDSELGVFANKADVSIVLHRDKGSIDNNITEFKVDKVRSKKHGCQITPDDHYLELHYNKYHFDFTAPKFHSNGTVSRVIYKNPLKNNNVDEDNKEFFDNVNKEIPTATPSEAFKSDSEFIDYDKMITDAPF